MRGARSRGIRPIEPRHRVALPLAVRAGACPPTAGRAPAPRSCASPAARDLPRAGDGRARLDIAPIALVSRPDVTRPLKPLVGALVFLDEAPGLAGRSDGAGAARLLASRARPLLLLSATPHSGDDRAFASLCALGRLGDDPLL